MNKFLLIRYFVILWSLTLNFELQTLNSIAQTASVLPVISPEEREKKPAGLRKHANEAFIRGEKLTYRAHYGWINAGEAVLEVKDESRKIGDRSTFHIVGRV